MEETRHHPAVELLLRPAAFSGRLQAGRGLARVTLQLLLFIVAASALYGAVLAGWRSPRLAGYVAIKLPLLLLGTTSLVMLLNWLTATALGSGLRFAQVVALTYGAMAVAGWILLGLTPVAAFFTWTAAPMGGADPALRFTHNCLLLTHIGLIALAGLAGNWVLWQRLREVARPGCRLGAIYWLWIAAFAFVGCQLSWILRPFVGSPFYPVVFMRPDCLQRNFYEFVFTEVLPYVLNGGG